MGLVVACFGGGTDSTSYIVRMVELRDPIDLIITADTGGEKPHTYEHIERFSEWLVDRGYPPVTMVYPTQTLESMCLRLETLPSKTIGFKTCSQRFKIEPADKFLNNWAPAREAWSRGEKIVKLIGYGLDDAHRAKYIEDDKYRFRYPLLEWKWDRAKSMAAIERAGLSQPGKSACFFCPSSRKAEVIDLAVRYPELATRAIAMERNNSKLTQVKGLGRHFSWEQLIASDAAGRSAIQECLVDQDCGCVDG
jgi:hypothetical protein